MKGVALMTAPPRSLHQVKPGDHVMNLFFLEKTVFDFQIKLFCHHPVKRELLDTKLEIHKDKTLREATEKAREVRLRHHTVIDV